ncbi:MAG: lactate utilization protein C [Bacillus sp. (in: firmicutes)]
MAGNIQNREAFLKKVAGRLGRETVPDHVDRPSYKYQPQHKMYQDAAIDDLLLMLKEHCVRIHTDYHQVTLSQLPDTLGQVIESFGGGPVMIPKDERFSEYGLEHLLKSQLPSQGHSLYEWDSAKGDENITLAEKSNVGITFSEMTLAESATVVLFSSPDKGRSVSLLPTTYIAIIPKSTIVPRMTQAAQYIREQVQKGEVLPSSINFVTGPSNSADIEMNLVVGVHGPVKAAYIVVDDK